MEDLARLRSRVYERDKHAAGWGTSVDVTAAYVLGHTCFVSHGVTTGYGPCLDHARHPYPNSNPYDVTVHYGASGPGSCSYGNGDGHGLCLGYGNGDGHRYRYNTHLAGMGGGNGPACGHSHGSGSGGGDRRGTGHGDGTRSGTRDNFGRTPAQEALWRV